MRLRHIALASVLSTSAAGIALVSSTAVSSSSSSPITIEPLPDMPEDTKMADVFGMNNPVMVGSGGDPQDIAEFVEACFDGSTLWPSGAAVVIDNGTPSCSLALCGFRVC